MKVELRPGLQGRAEAIVDTTNVAAVMGSGDLDVFATPAMIALMEQAAWTAVAPGLAEGESTVGTKLNISHVSATPVGLKVWAESEVTAVDGKKITFEVSAFDEAGEIGRGTHERSIIRPEKFLAKAQGKLTR